MSRFDDQIGDDVLGLLEGEALRAFEAAVRTDADLAARVTRFTAHLQSLDATVTPEPLPPDLWSRIDARLTSSKITALPARRRAAPRWFAMAASVVVAAGLGFAAGQAIRPPSPQPIVVAVLVSDDQSPGAIVEAFANNSIRIIPLEAIDVPAGKILEVWTKPNEEIGPVSLGRFLEAMDIVLPAASLPIPQGGQLYEITLEDAPGSASGKPTGPILFKGLGQIPV